MQCISGRSLLSTQTHLLAQLIKSILQVSIKYPSGSEGLTSLSPVAATMTLYDTQAVLPKVLCLTSDFHDRVLYLELNKLCLTIASGPIFYSIWTSITFGSGGFDFGTVTVRTPADRGMRIEYRVIKRRTYASETQVLLRNSHGAVSGAYERNGKTQKIWAGRRPLVERSSPKLIGFGLRCKATNASLSLDCLSSTC